MTPTTLQALRRLLFFSVPEAARWVARSAARAEGVTERAWRMWEAGTWPVPQDVSQRIIEMLAWRARALAEAEKAIKEAHAAMAAHGGSEAAPGQITWYINPESWAKAEPHAPDMWRPHCSVVAELCARHGCEAVPSD